MREMSGWTVAERYIADRLERIDAKLDDHAAKLYQIHGETSALKTRASIFGIFGGFLAALLSMLGLKHS